MTYKVSSVTLSLTHLDLFSYVRTAKPRDRQTTDALW